MPIFLGTQQNYCLIKMNIQYWILKNGKGQFQWLHVSNYQKKALSQKGCVAP